MNDELKPSTQNLAPSPTDPALWAELRQLDAAASKPLPKAREVQIGQDLYEVFHSYECLKLTAPEGQETLYYRMDAHERDQHQAYLTGCQHERLYQLQLLRKQRERRWLAIGAAFFFGFCAGMIVAAALNWGARF